ncbi:MAG: hypothetical protein NW220_21205 [Leptolyngbyaceae cyanobacterium bins.349]|nr:hypothetical protein [Leptolyngbyaceae cyanobacterium bins.349]
MLPDSHVAIAAFDCVLSDLVALAKATGRMETIFNLTEPAILSVTISFSGSGAIALMPLTPSIQVDFYAKSLHRRDELELGSVTLPTQAQQLVYTPAIALPAGLAAAGAMANQAYGISALVRVGATGFPAFVVGTIAGLMLQTYE